MDVYVFQAALLCETCGEAVECPLEVDDTRRADSDYNPQGPYPDGGGEADSPQHCDHCGVFLENPLTDDGRAYVREAIQDWQELSQGNAGVIATWQRHYRLG